MKLSEGNVSLITAARRIVPDVLAVREEAEQARRVPEPSAATEMPLIPERSIPLSTLKIINTQPYL